MTIEIRPLCDALGAEVIGADLTRPLRDDEIKAVDDAFLKHHLLCFRTEPLDPAAVTLRRVLTQLQTTA